MANFTNLHNESEAWGEFGIGRFRGAVVLA